MSSSKAPQKAIARSRDPPQVDIRPELSVIQPTSNPRETKTPGPHLEPTQKKKRACHRAGKKSRSRRRSFVPGTEDEDHTSGSLRPSRPEIGKTASRGSFGRVQGRTRKNSDESDVLMDHRDQANIRPRKLSGIGQSAFGVPLYESSTSYRLQQSTYGIIDSGNEYHSEDERAPLIKSRSGVALGYGVHSTEMPGRSRKNSNRLTSGRSSIASKRKSTFENSSPTFPYTEEYNVNYPPSMPGTPRLEPNQPINFGELLVGGSDGELTLDEISEQVIDEPSKSSTRRGSRYSCSKRSISLHAEEDISFPAQRISEIDERYTPQDRNAHIPVHAPRRRRGKWPHLSVLEEWSKFEQEGGSDERRAKKITEPQLIGGRLRPIHKGWHRAEDDAPYRFTYFNEQFQSTIHSQTISELVQPNGSFRELFIPDPPELSDSSESDSEHEASPAECAIHLSTRLNCDSRISSMAPSTRPTSPFNLTRPGSGYRKSASDKESTREIREDSIAGISPCDVKLSDPKWSPSPATKAESIKLEKPKRFGNRPIWWLDVLSPTDAEMNVLSKTFGIHPLTTEDILMQEVREKVELFHNYYFLNYRSFEQDTNNEDFLEPVNMYVIVFREGVISFHFSLTPHPANVRRRIRQLKDFLILSSDWISYAIIDDITDVFAPLIQNIEDEVDDIDDAILKLHSPISEAKIKKTDDKCTEIGEATFGETGGDMLRRVGDCRKKVMGLYRLLGNKADVIKGFAKRCNEHWDIAPRSEIGLYLGDIQDHIVTMTGNLSHYEKILARSHGNYLAQINIRMNERQEQTADVLGKLTVLGTIVLPMNIITGLWGMNVWVPGQGADGDLTWFCYLTAGLLLFGLSCFLIAKVLYRIV
ncbi:putative metal ion transporter [Podosphaera aphanis]|nr:putative metal ion transporter [Podosphaera aphanis]